MAAPGWYPDPDPSRAGGWRWWDGWQWGPSAPVSVGGLTPQDVEAESSVARWAKIALIGQACGQVLSLVMLPSSSNAQCMACASDGVPRWPPPGSLFRS